MSKKPITVIVRDLETKEKLGKMTLEQAVKLGKGKPIGDGTCLENSRV